MLALGQSGRVLAVDLAGKMLARGRLKAVQQDLSNIEFRRADVEHLDFEDGSFDAVSRDPRCKEGGSVHPRESWIRSTVRRLNPSQHDRAASS